MKYKYEDFNEFDLEDMKNFLEDKVKSREIVDDGTLEDIKEYLRNQNEDYIKCNELISQAIDLLNNSQDNKMVCPMCEEGYMIHEEYNGTHIYICEPCPFVGFELVETKDRENMIKWLEERK